MRSISRCWASSSPPRRLAMISSSVRPSEGVRHWALRAAHNSGPARGSEDGESRDWDEGESCDIDNEEGVEKVERANPVLAVFVALDDMNRINRGLR
jgi:hypothetical protein